MPEADGRLNALDQAAILTHLGSKWKHRKCPCCETERWIAGQHLLRDDFVTALPQVIDGEVSIVPYVALFCANCGYVLRFNAAMIPGLLPTENYERRVEEPPATAPAKEVSGG